jgi:hypothetical protein
MARIVASHPGMAVGLTAVANEIADTAEAEAVRGSTGRWAGSFRAVAAELVDGVQTAYVVSDHPVATIIEFGSVNNPPDRALTRAAMAAGRLVDLGG